MTRLLYLIIFVVTICSIRAQEKITISEILGKQIPLGGNTNPYKLRKEVYQAYMSMREAAKQKGIEIQIASGYRSYSRQKFIWESKFKRYKAKGLTDQQAIQKIIKYSTFPGTSRHHWGTDIDIIQKVEKMPTSLLLSENFDNNGVFCELHEWLKENAAHYGFYLVYTDDEKRQGFSYEPWHYSYEPISKQFLKTAIELKAYNALLKNQKDLLSREYIITHILGINSYLKSFD